MITIAGVTMSRKAALVVEATGTDVAADLAAAKARPAYFNRAVLLYACLEGAEDEETVQAWTEYVEAISLAVQ